jgi:hypothetical protein
MSQHKVVSIGGLTTWSKINRYSQEEYGGRLGQSSGQ